MLSDEERSKLSAEDLDKAIEAGEAAARSPEEQSAIDKSRLSEQQLEQEKSNTARANQSAREAQAGLETAEAENATLQQKLTDAEAKASEAGIKDVELDPGKYEGDDVAMVQAINSIKDQMKIKDAKIETLAKKAEAYEEAARQKEAKAAGVEAYEDLLKDLDKDYGADHRNKAVEAFNILKEAGEVPKGQPAKATRILEHCYKEAKAVKDKADADKKDKTLKLDTPGGGDAPNPNLTSAEIKEGSLDDVADQYAVATKKT